MVPAGAESGGILITGYVSGWLVSAITSAFTVTSITARDLAFSALPYTVDANGTSIGFPTAFQPFAAVFPLAYVGTEASGSSTARMIRDGSEQRDVAIPQLMPGASTYLYWSFPSGLPAGSTTIDAYLDWYNQLLEVNKSNNFSSMTIRVG